MHSQITQAWVLLVLITGACCAEQETCTNSDSQERRHLSLQQPASLASLKKPIKDLYDTSKFIKQAKAAANPIPSCCPAAKTGRSLQQQKLNVSDAGCDKPGGRLGISSKWGHWGYWYDGLEPAMVVQSGAEFSVDMATFLAASGVWAEMGAGDAGMEDLYAWDEQGPRVPFKGPDGVSGGHVMNGPIYVCGAEPGDVLQVDILDLVPRYNPGANNDAYGVTVNGGIGWHAKVGYVTEGQTIANEKQAVLFKVIKDPKTGDALYWEPQWSWNHADPSISAVTPGCIPQSGPLPRTTAAGAGIFNHTEWPMYAGKAVPCEENSQLGVLKTWTSPMFGYEGVKYDVPEALRDYSVKGKYRLPWNGHIGNIGLAPSVGAPVKTGPPFRTGGNLDNRRIGKGATMYFPVEVAGALLSMGDCHGHQGDGESAATGVEASMNGDFRVTLHKAGSLPPKLQLLDYPLLENENEFIIHGYAYRDWIREIPNAQQNVGEYGPVGGIDLNRAMDVVYNETRDFLLQVYPALSESDALNVLSHIDFGITQVVDANVGLHARIPKWLFNSSMWDEQPHYEALVKDGTSRTSYP